MSESDLYYLRTILRRLRAFKQLISDDGLSLGSEALADEIDWLDCFIDAKARNVIAKAKGEA